MSERSTVAQVTVGNVVFGGVRLAAIAGPCVIENAESSLRHAEKIAAIARAAEIPIVFKSSFDKANRTSLGSFRGAGLDEGLRILGRVKDATGLAILTDIHEPWQAAPVAEIADILQIPALLSRQTDLIVAAARTGRVVNLKKGQFLAPWDMKAAIGKAQHGGNQRILVTERGFSFGYNNLVSDMRSVVIMRGFGYPVVFDATHSVQLPGAGTGGERSGGQREFIPPLARAAIAAGADAIFMEVHEDPDHALSDGANSLSLSDLSTLLLELQRIRVAINS
ncbi:MAG TPA: 3-deoxy-8-phosphooctulonate synthase [Candidatus Binataceae bacterium]|jgi:2-dehydro-3-deoxyphosphooctonate aldolase (KDO 8-P synthase)|nr:3-deoxy-8-phosphooctulonate synthase [Candidatus Binataceae bacterium]